MKSRTAILGGGFGGLATATELRRLLGAGHEIVVVDRRETYYMGLRKLWVLVGRASLAEGERPLARLSGRGIRFVRAEITRIEPPARRVATDAGSFEAEYLVVSLGAEPRADRVPGLSGHPRAFNLYDPESVQAAARRLASFEGGRVVVAIAGLPYKCPPAPYEAAMLVDDGFRERALRERVDLTFTTLQPMLLPNAGPAGARWMGDELTRRGIAWHANKKLTRIEADRLVYEDGELPFDLALVTPPHVCPQVVRDSGLTDDGEWVKVDPHTLTTAQPGVFAIGDATNIPLANRLALPKAGIFAEAHGRRVAHAIAADLLGGPPAALFDGRGACFLEMGGGQAAMVEGEFYAEPEPAVRILGASPEYLEEKRRFETERLARWFEGREH
ncbi:MAG: NAD(P)/FAD-dependent oxidoreductase [Gemmatimonadetes bacterium]|nr:NAD(P)/FAD-dependent oxidoreductase [Gemmatimonadota bacterium]